MIIYHQHIFTGDLRIIKNNKFKKLFAKGPKYKENNNASREGTKASIMERLNGCIALTHSAINMALIDLSLQKK